MREISALTINAWSGLNYRGVWRMGCHETAARREERYRALVAEIMARRPDVIAVNEANPLPGYARRLAGDTGYDCIWHMGVSGIRLGRIGIPVNLREGDMILAKPGLSLRMLGRRKLYGPGFVSNGASIHTGDLTQVLLGSIAVSGERINIAATHLHLAMPHNAASLLSMGEMCGRQRYSRRAIEEAFVRLQREHEARMKECDRLIRWLRSSVPPESPLLLMGDFNAEPDSLLMRKILDAGFHDAFRAAENTPGHTWDAENNSHIRRYYVPRVQEPHEDLYRHALEGYELKSRRIDYILCNGLISESSVLGCGLCLNSEEYGVQPSDHFGVFARIAL